MSESCTYDWMVSETYDQKRVPQLPPFPISSHRKPLERIFPKKISNYRQFRPPTLKHLTSRVLLFFNLYQCLSFQFPAQYMDTSSPSVFVNGSLLRRYLGQKVRAVIQVMRSDSGTVIGKSTDDQQIVVRGSPPAPLTNYVEVIGIAENSNSIRAEIWTNFGDTFDTRNYNELCQLANGEFKHLFI